MNESEQANSWRAQFAAKNRLRALENRERKYTWGVAGLVGFYSLSNLLSGVMLLGKSPLDAGIGILVGIAYLFACYRVWAKDDIRWWPPGIPATFSVVFLLLAWAGGMPRPVPIALNILLLILVPLRARAFNALAAAPDNSFKPNPLRGST